MILVSCKPEVEKPTVVTKSIGDITETSAKVVGQVTTDGGAEVTERGICWNTDGTPAIQDSHVKDIEGGLGSYEILFADLVPNTQYYVRAYATNEAGTSYGEIMNFMTLQESDDEDEDEENINGTENGHEYVDLGLSVRWATCNIGATSPEAYGDYFAWGETTTKGTYTENNSTTYELSYSQLQSQGFIDGDGKLAPQYDAATVNWGGSWRMPTYDELAELKNNCTWTWINADDFNGYKVTGPNDNSIFLPAAGYRSGSSLYYVGDYGYYWCSMPDMPDMGSDYSYLLDFGSDYRYLDVSYRRDIGQSVRPVCGGGSLIP